MTKIWRIDKEVIQHNASICIFLDKSKDLEETQYSLLWIVLSHSVAALRNNVSDTIWERTEHIFFIAQTINKWVSSRISIDDAICVFESCCQISSRKMCLDILFWDSSEILRQIWDRSETHMGQFWDNSETLLGHFGDKSETVLGDIGDNSGTILGQFGDNSQTIQRQFWDNSGTMLNKILGLEENGRKWEKLRRHWFLQKIDS